MSCFGSDVASTLGGVLREFLLLFMPFYKPEVMAIFGDVPVELILDGLLVGFAQPDTEDLD